MLVWLKKNGFGPAFWHSLLRLEKAQPRLTPAVDWLNDLIGPGGLLVVVSHLFAVPVLVLRVGLEKSI